MHPVCLIMGDRVIYWYGILMATAFLAGILTWWGLGRREGRDAAWASDLAFWAMLAGIVGARVAYIISDWHYFWANPLQIWRVDRGGLIFYGGFVGTILMVLFMAWRRKESALSLGDLMVTALPLGHFLGRIGCFLNGCCFGKPLPGAWGVQFPADSPAWWAHTESGLITSEARWSLPVHAVQLHEAALNFLLFFVLVYAYPRRRRPGDIVALYLMLYPPIRFCLELLRGDQREQWGHLSVAQGMSLIFFLAGLILWFARPATAAKNSSTSAISPP